MDIPTPFSTLYLGNISSSKILCINQETLNVTYAESMAKIKIPIVNLISLNVMPKDIICDIPSPVLSNAPKVESILAREIAMMNVLTKNT